MVVVYSHSLVAFLYIMFRYHHVSVVRGRVAIYSPVQGAQGARYPTQKNIQVIEVWVKA